MRQVGRHEADSFVSVFVRQHPHPRSMIQETYAHEVNVALKDRRALRCESLWLQHTREKDALHTALVAVPLQSLQPISHNACKRPSVSLGGASEVCQVWCTHRREYSRGIRGERM